MRVGIALQSQTTRDTDRYFAIQRGEEVGPPVWHYDFGGERLNNQPGYESYNMSGNSSYLSDGELPKIRRWESDSAVAASR